MNGNLVMKKAGRWFGGYIKGVVTALFTTIVCIFLFAIILKFVGISDMAIKIINQIIKVLSIFLGVNVFLKRNNNGAVIKGLFVGIVYTVLSYCVFSVLSKSFSFGLNFLFDAIFSCAVGAICGGINAFLRK